jgi:NAD-dependent dihydropyrimidine dehydrogenase PreA subunit
MADNFRLIKTTTKDFYREGKKTREYSLFDFIHGYLYAKWPYLYISVAIGEHPLSRFLASIFLSLSSLLGHSMDEGVEPEIAWADSYHGKVVPLEEAIRLVSIQEEIEILDLEKIIPYTRAKDIILKNPDRIVALDCPCREARENPCRPLDVCLVIGDPFVSFILDHQPEKSRQISSHEAMEILQEEHQRGHVSHAFFKDAMLNRFYAICNCCSCCCGAFQSHQNGTPMLMSSGYTASIDPNLCESCEICVDYCQFFAIEMEEGFAVVNQDACFGCGVCVDQCAEGAAKLDLDPSKGEPLEILSLMEVAKSSV